MSVGAAANSRMLSNGEAEGPRDGASRATRAHTVFQRPRSQTRSASRTPPAIVRRQNEVHRMRASQRPPAQDGLPEGTAEFHRCEAKGNASEQAES